MRRIRVGDGPLLRDVRLRALQADPDAFGSSYEREVTRSDDVWEEIAADSASGHEQIIVVAETDEGFVAMSGAFTRPENLATRHVYGMWVAPEARGSGLGSRLVGAVTEWSAEAGADEMKLWVVESNLPAMRLYERSGFSPSGETQRLPSNPDLVEIGLRLALR